MGNDEQKIEELEEKIKNQERRKKMRKEMKISGKSILQLQKIIKNKPQISKFGKLDP